MTVSGLAINERCSPRGPRPCQPGPEPTVGFHKVQPSRARALEHLQLMAQGKYLEVSATRDIAKPRSVSSIEINTDVIAKKGYPPLPRSSTASMCTKFSVATSG